MRCVLAALAPQRQYRANTALTPKVCCALTALTPRTCCAPPCGFWRPGTARTSDRRASACSRRSANTKMKAHMPAGVSPSACSHCSTNMRLRTHRHACKHMYMQTKAYTQTNTHAHKYNLLRAVSWCYFQFSLKPTPSWQLRLASFNSSSTGPRSMRRSTPAATSPPHAPKRNAQLALAKCPPAVVPLWEAPFSRSTAAVKQMPGILMPNALPKHAPPLAGHAKGCAAHLCRRGTSSSAEGAQRGWGGEACLCLPCA